MLIKFYNNGSNGKLACLSPAYYLQSLKVYTAWCRVSAHHNISSVIT